MSEETPDTPETPPTPGPGGDAAPGRPADPTPPPGKRRPKDSEFFELPPDLKKLPPGGLPATVSSGGPSPKDAPKPAGKGGCGGLLLFAAGAAASAAALLLLVS